MKRIKKIGFVMAALMGLFFPMMNAQDKAPSFPGGDEALKKYLKDNTHYPEIAKENGVEGIVEVGFIVLVDGQLKNIKVVRFIDPDLEKEAVRVVEAMPAWIPAEKDGAAIEAPASVDVPFLLE